MRAYSFLLISFSQREGLRKRLVASQAQVFVCGHIALRKCYEYSTPTGARPLRFGASGFGRRIPLIAMKKLCAPSERAVIYYSG
jgi:hypothetical protein